MPLQKAATKEAVSHNISELTHHGSRPRSHKQIVAIALHTADESKKHSSSKKRGAPPSHEELAEREDTISRHEKKLDLDDRERSVKARKSYPAVPKSDVPESPIRGGDKLPAAKLSKGKKWSWD